MEPWELTAREEIRNLVAAYAHCADTGRSAELAALFAPAGILETPDGVEHRGTAAIEAFLEATRRAAGASARRIRHHVSSLWIEVEGPEAASGRAYFLVVTENGSDHWGRYRDRYLRHDGVWRFAHRRVRLDGRAPGAQNAR